VSVCVYGRNAGGTRAHYETRVGSLRIPNRGCGGVVGARTSLERLKSWSLARLAVKEIDSEVDISPAFACVFSQSCWCLGSIDGTTGCIVPDGCYAYADCCGTTLPDGHSCAYFPVALINRQPHLHWHFDRVMQYIDLLDVSLVWVFTHWAPLLLLILPSAPPWACLGAQGCVAAGGVGRR
jgi:hypothetical protein